MFRYLPDLVSAAALEAMLADARFAPTITAAVPWEVHIVSGKTRKRLVQALKAAAGTGEITPDFETDETAIWPTAQTDFALPHYLDFFGAPHIALLFMRPVAESLSVAADAGLYCGALLEALPRHGLVGVLQTKIALYAGTVREVLDMDPSLKMLSCIAFGFPDPQYPDGPAKEASGNKAELVFHPCRSRSSSRSRMP